MKPTVTPVQAEPAKPATIGDPEGKRGGLPAEPEVTRSGAHATDAVIHAMDMARVDGARCVVARLQTFLISLETGVADRTVLAAARGALEVATMTAESLEATARWRRG